MLVEYEKKKKGDPAEVISNNKFLKNSLKYKLRYPNISKIIADIFRKYKS